jgi:hypothetical protein
MCAQDSLRNAYGSEARSSGMYAEMGGFRENVVRPRSARPAVLFYFVMHSFILFFIFYFSYTLYLFFSPLPVVERIQNGSRKLSPILLANPYA